MTKYRKLQARILTAIVGCPVIVAAVYFGDVPFLTMIMLLAILCLNEFLPLLRGNNKEAHRFDILVYVASLVLILSAHSGEAPWIWDALWVKITIATGILYFLWELFSEKVYFKEHHIMDSLRSIFYIGFFFPFFVLIRGLPEHGLGYTIFLTFAIWVNDSFAYFIGLTLGRHKLNPKISPKKSLEGAWGGFLATLIYAYFIGPYVGFSSQQALFVGAVLSLLAQGGDLLESLYKRTANTKDASTVLPGHGGFLDRMDSFILTGPVYYFLLIHYFIK
ncbi:phosphatidate cytidylyltransferase [Candidatus Margulisiibacteriota bacterium]